MRLCSLESKDNNLHCRYLNRFWKKNRKFGIFVRMHLRRFFLLRPRGQSYYHLCMLINRKGLVASRETFCTASPC